MTSYKNSLKIFKFPKLPPCEWKSNHVINFILKTNKYSALFWLSFHYTIKLAIIKISGSQNYRDKKLNFDAFFKNEMALNMKEQGVYISFMYNNHSDQNKIKTITASDFLSSF